MNEQHIHNFEIKTSENKATNNKKKKRCVELASLFTKKIENKMMMNNHPRMNEQHSYKCLKINKTNNKEKN